MRIYESPGILDRYRRTEWEFQQTFLTPLQELPLFVDVIISSLHELAGAMAVFEQVVFDPQYQLLPLYEKYGLQWKWYGDNLTFEAQDKSESRELLQAVLSEWIDFFYLPTPATFVIYADHDEFITFLAHRREPLAGLTAALIAENFRQVDYVRVFQSD